MAKVTLSKIEDQLSEIQRQLSASLSDTENDTNISPDPRAFDDQLFTPLRTDVLKFLLQEDEPFSAKKELFDAIQTTGKEILNAAQGQGVIINSPLDMVIGELRELDDLVTRTVIRDQKISLEGINEIHKQYLDDQSFINKMGDLYPEDNTVNILGELDILDFPLIHRLWSQKQKLQPDPRQDHAAISVTDNQGQHEPGDNQEVVSQQCVQRQAMVEIIFRQLCFSESRLPEINTALSTDLLFELFEDITPEFLQKIQEKLIECYLLQLDLFNELNGTSMTVENESVVLSTGEQSLDIANVMELINGLKRSDNPIDVGLIISKMLSQEEPLENKEEYLSKYDEYLVFLSKKDREKLSPNFVKQALQKNKINGLLLSDTILKLGPVFIDSLFAKDNGIEEVNLTPQCAEKMLMLKGLSERTRAQLRLKLPTWKKLEVENVIAYLKSEYCHNEDPELTDLKKALGETIVKAALENNQLSDSGRMRHISSLFPMLTESECAEMIFPKEWNDNIEGTEGQDADHELIGSLYLCGLAGWKPEITRANTGNGTMTGYTIANDDGESSFQQIQGQKNSQSDDEKSEQDSNQTVDSMVKNPTDRLNFLSLMKSKGIKQIASSITEKRDLSTKLIIDLFDKGLGYDNLSEEQLKQGNPLSHASGFLGSQDWQQLRATQKEFEQEQKDALGDQVKNNPDQERTEENNENIEPGSSGGFRK